MIIIKHKAENITNTLQSVKDMGHSRHYGMFMEKDNLKKKLNVNC